MKKLVFLICFFLFTSSLSPINSEENPKDKSFKEQFINKIDIHFEYTYVWVLRDGIWWILVYDQDGKLVNEYPAE